VKHIFILVKPIGLLLMITMTLSSFAEDSQVIDLGVIKVKGDLRRPTTEFYQLKALKPEQLKEISELSFSQFESKILMKKGSENESN